MAETVRAFVCGHPVAHSRSPMIHNHWLQTLGIDGTYERIDVTPVNFGDFLAALPGSGLAGGNCTIPHKEAAFAAIGRRDAAAQAIGAINTVWLEDGRLAGGNTDAYGFSANLDDRAYGWRDAETATVIGAGGAARAVVHALAEAGIGRILIANRTGARAADLADRFRPAARAVAWEALGDALPGTDLLVNTTSMGMEGGDEFMLDIEALPDSAIVTDIVYSPLRTPLLGAAEARGIRTADGLGMLLHQAVGGFERWFGTRPAVTPQLRALVEADLEERH